MIYEPPLSWRNGIIFGLYCHAYQRSQASPELANLICLPVTQVWQWTKKEQSNDEHKKVFRGGETAEYLDDSRSA